jgi:hypothetical protein
MGATAAGMEKAPVTLEDSINGMLSKVIHHVLSTSGSVRRTMLTYAQD